MERVSKDQHRFKGLDQVKFAEYKKQLLEATVQQSKDEEACSPKKKKKDEDEEEKASKVTLSFHIIFKIFRTHLKDTNSAKLLTYQNISHTAYEVVSVFRIRHMELGCIFKNLNYLVGHMER